jgi:hypothetical protein
MCKFYILFIGTGRVAIILDGVDFGMVGGGWGGKTKGMVCCVFSSTCVSVDKLCVKTVVKKLDCPA